MDFLFDAQGEDVVSGRRTPERGEGLSARFPELARELSAALVSLEAAFSDVQDVEFTIERGRLWFLQTRSAKRSPRAALRISVDQVSEGLITTAEALRRLQEIDRARLSITRFEQKPEPIASGISAAPGMASGRVALDSEMAVKMSRNTDPVVLLRPDTSTADVAGFAVACGILTATGGRTAPAALVARQLGKPCIVGCDALVFDMVGRPGWVRPRSGKAIGFR